MPLTPTTDVANLANLPVLRMDLARVIGVRAATRRLGFPLTANEQSAVNAAIEATLACLEAHTRRIELCPLCHTMFVETESGQLGCPQHGPVLDSWYGSHEHLLAVVFDRLPADAGEQILKGFK